MTEGSRPRAVRRYRKHRPRVRDAARFDGRTLAAILTAVRDVAEVVYLTGDVGTLADYRAWLDGPLPDGWQVDGSGHYLPNVRRPISRFVRPSGDVVELHRSTSWGFDEDDKPRQVLDALALLDVQLADVFDEYARCLTTPATTGRDLWLRSIPYGHEGYPTLAGDVQELIRTTSGQGRWQVVRARCCDGCLPPRESDGNVAAVLHGFDMRFGYAALLWGLGVGPAQVDDVDEYAGMRRGRYQVTFTVPDGWEHVGLLPVPRDDGRWHYPNRPGSTWTTWVDGAELHVAYAHGWHDVTIKRRILLHNGRPLDGWQSRLLETRERLRDVYRSGDVDRATVCAAADAVRMILLTALGAFHGARHNVTHEAPLDEPESIDPDARGLRQVDGRWMWNEEQPAAWPETSHPEWSSAVWARCRARMLDHSRASTGALHVPYEAVVGIRQDGLYLTCDPGWNDDGKVGTLRHDWRSSRPVPVPATVSELMEARR